MFLSLFQTASGSWHVQSILIASGWLVTGVLLIVQLAANRTERIKSFEKEQQHLIKITELENKTKPIPLLQSTMNEQVKKIAEKSKQVEAYQQKLTDAEQTAKTAQQLAIQLEEKQKPRHLTEQQHHELKLFLKDSPKCKITLTAPKIDGEATTYAAEIGAELSAAGFAVVNYSGPLLLRTTPGLWLAVNSNEIQPQSAWYIYTAFQKANVPCDVYTDPKIEPDELTLGVGAKK